MAKYYILVTSDGYSVNSLRVSAKTIIEFRISQGYWPIYENTRNRISISCGDGFVLYVGGVKECARTFIGFGEFGSDYKSADIFFEEDGLDILSPNPERLIAIQAFSETKPVPVGGVLRHLAAYRNMKNKRRWGVLFMGGCRRVSEEEFKKLSEAIRKSQSHR